MSEENVYKAEQAAKLNVQSSLPAFVLIGVGAALLLAYLFDVRLLDFFWPGFVIAPGLLLMWPAYKSTDGEIRFSGRAGSDDRYHRGPAICHEPHQSF